MEKKNSTYSVLSNGWRWTKRSLLDCGAYLNTRDCQLFFFSDELYEYVSVKI